VKIHTSKKTKHNSQYVFAVGVPRGKYCPRFLKTTNIPTVFRGEWDGPKQTMLKFVAEW